MALSPRYSPAVNERFNALVSSCRMTLPSHPTQYEGVLADGRAFYFRYRFGRAQLGVGATLDDAVKQTCDDPAVSLTHGEQWDGEVTEEQFQALFVQIADSVHGCAAGQA